MFSLGWVTDKKFSLCLSGGETRLVCALGRGTDTHLVCSLGGGTDTRLVISSGGVIGYKFIV